MTTFKRVARTFKQKDLKTRVVLKILLTTPLNPDTIDFYIKK